MSNSKLRDIRLKRGFVVLVLCAVVLYPVFAEEIETQELTGGELLASAETPADVAPSTDPASTETPADVAPSTDPASTETPADVAPSTDPASTETPADVAPSTDPASTETPADVTPSTDPASTETPVDAIPSTDILVEALSGKAALEKVLEDHMQSINGGFVITTNEQCQFASHIGIENKEKISEMILNCEGKLQLKGKINLKTMEGEKFKIFFIDTAKEEMIEMVEMDNVGEKGFSLALNNVGTVRILVTATSAKSNFEITEIGF